MASADPREQVAIACRALDAKGLGAGIGGHVSLRADDGGSYWVNRVDREFAEIDGSDVVGVDIETGDVISGESLPSPGVSFHNAIYRARPDVGAIVHSHAEWITTLTALRRPLRMLNVKSTYFLGDDLVVSRDDELDSVAPSLGAASALLIPYHGGITVGADLPRAAALHVTLEEAARVDCHLEGTGVEPMAEQEARKIRSIMESADYLALTWDLLERLGSDGR